MADRTLEISVKVTVATTHWITVDDGNPRWRDRAISYAEEDAKAKTNGDVVSVNSEILDEGGG